MKNLHVKRDDMVVVISGEDRGKIGKVLATYPAKNRVLVEGINIIKKSLRKSQDNPKGGIVSKEGSIQISKVMKQDRYEARRKKRGAAPATAEA
jgi:large subunit ribosomal protein L24